MRSGVVNSSFNLSRPGFFRCRSGYHQHWEDAIAIGIELAEGGPEVGVGAESGGGHGHLLEVWRNG